MPVEYLLRFDEPSRRRGRLHEALQGESECLAQKRRSCGRLLVRREVAPEASSANHEIAMPHFSSTGDVTSLHQQARNIEESIT
jgi:hypothetical protein